MSSDRAGRRGGPEINPAARPPEFDAAKAAALRAFLEEIDGRSERISSVIKQVEDRLEVLAQFADDQSWAATSKSLKRKLSVATELRAATWRYIGEMEKRFTFREDRLLLEAVRARHDAEGVDPGYDDLGEQRAATKTARALVVSLERQVRVLGAAASGVPGRPSGSYLDPIIRGLARIWIEFAGVEKATVTRRQVADGTPMGEHTETSGNFLVFCRLAIDCLPGASERHGSGIEAAVRRLADKPSKPRKRSEV